MNFYFFLAAGFFFAAGFFLAAAFFAAGFFLAAAFFAAGFFLAAAFFAAGFFAAAFFTTFFLAAGFFLAAAFFAAGFFVAAFFAAGFFLVGIWLVNPPADYFTLFLQAVATTFLHFCKKIKIIFSFFPTTYFSKFTFGYFLIFIFFVLCAQKLATRAVAISVFNLIFNLCFVLAGDLATRLFA